MAWTAPMTAVANTAFTAAQFNTNVRDNLLETAPGKASAAGQLFLATAANAIAARDFKFSTISTSQSTSNTSYVDLASAGPQVTLTTGTKVACLFSVQVQNDTANVASRYQVEVSGASSIAADDSYEGVVDGMPAGQAFRSTALKVFDTLTAGSNTFTMKYKVSSGTGTFAERILLVFPMN